MKYFLVKTIIDDAGNAIAELEDREMPADEVIAALAARSAVAAPAPKPGKEKKTKQKKVKAGKKGKRTVTCKGCGEQGHIQKTCPNKNGRVAAPAPEAAPVSSSEGPADKSADIRRMLLDGFKDPDIAEECQVKERTVAFIRRGMISRGELTA